MLLQYVHHTQVCCQSHGDQGIQNCSKNLSDRNYKKHIPLIALVILAVEELRIT